MTKARVPRVTKRSSYKPYFRDTLDFIFTGSVKKYTPIKGRPWKILEIANVDQDSNAMSCATMLSSIPDFITIGTLVDVYEDSTVDMAVEDQDADEYEVSHPLVLVFRLASDLGEETEVVVHTKFFANFNIEEVPKDEYDDLKSIFYDSVDTNKLFDELEASGIEQTNLNNSLNETIVDKGDTENIEFEKEDLGKNTETPDDVSTPRSTEKVYVRPDIVDEIAKKVIEASTRKLQEDRGEGGDEL